MHGNAPISKTGSLIYRLANDRQRLLVNRYVKPDQVAALNIVLNASNGKAEQPRFTQMF